MGIIQQVKLYVICLCFVSCSPSGSRAISPVIEPKPELHASPQPAPSEPPEVIVLPAAPKIVSQARDLILDFEGFDHHPDWPQGSSGVTVGIGYDTGYYKQAVIVADWERLPERHRLGDCAGITGTKARDKVRTVKDIFIPTDTGTGVFDNVDVPREYDNSRRAFPGFENLSPNAQGALISLVYNRGSGMSGDSRKEMRNIRSLVPKKDYKGIAREIRDMKRIWVGTSIENGMNRRRDAEAKLAETP